MRTPEVAILASLLGAGLMAAPAFAQERNPERNAYFGEEHLHTGWSLDTWLMGNKLTGPDEAYKYAQGEPITHPQGYTIRIDTPLDFMGVTDHSEYVGVTKLANTPGSALSKLPEAQPLIIHDPNNKAEIAKTTDYVFSLFSQTTPPVKALISPEVAGTVWKENNEIAEKNNHPGKFTTFCSYEWTSNVNYRNLHRNIFFRDCAKVPVAPFSSLDPGIPKTFGSGWTVSARPATSSSRFRTMRI